MFFFFEKYRTEKFDSAKITLNKVSEDRDVQKKKKKIIRRRVKKKSHLSYEKPDKCNRSC